MAIIQQLRAKAFGAFALFFCASLAMGGAAVSAEDGQSALDPEADFAVYVAKIDEMEFRSFPPCPVDEICMWVYYDLKLTPIEIIAGNPNIGTQTFVVSQGARYRDGVSLIVYVKRDEGGAWTLVDRSSVSVEACLEVAVEEDIEDLASDWTGDFEEGDNWERYCFSRQHRAD